jgi:coenzyme F420-0:L-glutamate ligase / coenzyme F420-1:gamma-L-glutamate ligase
VLSLLPVVGLPLIEPDAPLADLIVDRFTTTDTFQANDILVVAQKVISKAERRVVTLRDIVPSARALELAATSEKDPHLVELILRESREVIRVRPGLLVVEDTRGFICANAGIDRSNIEQSGEDEEVALLPLDPDASARALRARISERTGISIGVIINDSHGRAWREGTVGVTIGLAGVPAISDRRGDRDLTGYTLQHTIIGIADEIAAAASLLMGPGAEGIPAVVVRGLHLQDSTARASDIQRPREFDLFR